MGVLFRPDTVSFATHVVGTLLFAGIFAFLYRESRHVYFSYWAMAWVLKGTSLLLQLCWMVSGRALFLAPAGLLELAFAASLLFAGTSVSSRVEARIRPLVLLLPAVGAAGYAFGVLTGIGGSGSLLALLVGATYGWSFVASVRLWKAGAGSGRKMFCVSLLGGVVLSACDAVSHLAAEMEAPGATPAYFQYQPLYYLTLETLLAFSAMMMWMEEQNEQLRQANEDLARSRLLLSESAQRDPLTGLLNRASLEETCDAGHSFTGVVAVLDLDNFKDINDALGHLAGDEVLASVGALIRSSIRRTDQAWRWGGDEFVILFGDQHPASVEERLRGLQEHLERFRIRGRGVLPVHVTWGIAPLSGGPLRQAIADADHQMYLKKREKSSASKFFGP